MKKLFTSHLTQCIAFLPIFLLPFIVIGQITRQQIINNATPYTSYSWSASACNTSSWNGVSCGGRTVYRAPWVVNGTNISMPYMWGGWSTTAQHSSAMNSCKSAGDVCSSGGGGCSGNTSGLSQQCASGHDCSGLVSRAWALTNKQGTTTLPNFATQILFSQLQQGDIVNDEGSHTRLISTYNTNGSATVIEASGTDWKTSYRTYSAINQTGYVALCYNNVVGGCASVAVPTISLSSPSSNATNVSCPVNFSWTSTPSSNIEYRIQVSTSSSGFTTTNGFTTSANCNSTVVVNVNTLGSSSFSWNAVTTGVCASPVANTTYYWSVRVYDVATGQTSSYAPVRSFTTGANCGGGGGTPANDNCSLSNSVLITGLQVGQCISATSGEDIAGATQSLSASTNCGGAASVNAYDVWFRFVATCTTHDITVNPSTSMDAAVSVHSSCSGSSLACADNAGGANANETVSYGSFAVGNTYYIRVYDYNNTAGAGTYPATTTFDICVNTPSSGCSGSGGGEDITVTNATVTPTSVQAGGTINVTADQNYSGTQLDANLPSFDLDYYLSTDCSISGNDILLGGDISSLGSDDPVNAEDEALIIPAGTTAGSYYILFVADADAELNESNENNNVACVPITVSGGSGGGEDITVTNATVTPTSVLDGGTINVTADQNYSGTQLDANLPSFDLDYYLSTDCSISGNDILLGGDISSLGSDDPVNAEDEALIIPAGTTAGSYYILFVADADAELNESNENNNVACVQITVSGGSGGGEDITVTNATVTPTSVLDGGTINVTADQNYSGTQLDANLPSFDLDYYLSTDCSISGNDILLGGDISSLGSDDPVNAEDAALIIPAGTAAGSYYLLFVADADAELNESNENNNVACVPITISGTNPCIPPSNPLSVSASSPSICTGDATVLTVNGGNLGSDGWWSWYAGDCNTGSFVGIGGSRTVNPSQTTTYYVRAESSCGNTTCASYTVTVNQYPSTPSPSASAATACVGQTVNLSANTTADSYNWTGPVFSSSAQNPQVSINPQSFGTYNLFVTINGCTSQAGSVIIGQGSVPSQPSLITGQATVCSSQIVGYGVTSVSGATSYTWTYSGVGATTGTGQSISLTPTSSGVLSVTANNSCGSSAPRTLSINVTPLPIQPGINSSTGNNLCAGQSTTLDATNICSGCFIYLAAGKSEWH
jgi:hypothetical protein